MKERVVLVGGGGHAKVIIDLLEQTDEVDIAGCTTQDDGQREVLGYPILGPDELLPEIFRSGVRHAFAAIGDNRARLKHMHRLKEIGFTLINAVSSGAIVSP